MILQTGKQHTAETTVLSLQLGQHHTVGLNGTLEQRGQNCSLKLAVGCCR